MNAPDLDGQQLLSSFIQRNLYGGTTLYEASLQRVRFSRKSSVGTTDDTDEHGFEE